jgi:hypothetical protein
MSDDFEPIRKKVWDELVMLHDTLDEYTYLFMKDEERVALLNQSGSWFFGRVQQYMRMALILGISRLTDTAGTGSRTNLTLEVLLSDPLLEGKPEVRSELEQCIVAVRETAATVRNYRHKQIAHLDHAVALGDAREIIGFISVGDLRALITEMEAIYNVHGLHTRDSTAFFDLNSMGRASRMVKRLEKGKQKEDEEIAVRRALLRQPD